MNRFAKTYTLSACALAAAGLLSACGGGDAGAPFSSTASTGYAVDGYLKDASVKCDASGIVVKTDSAGFFRFPDGCSSPLTLTGGINQDTLLPFAGTLKAPAGSKMVTPLTTLLVGGMTQSQVNASLGLPADTDLTNTDPALMSAGTLVHPDLLKKTLAVQQLLMQTTEAMAAFAGDSSDATRQAIYSEVAAAFAAGLKGGAKLNATATTVDLAVLKTVVTAAGTKLATSTLVPPAVKSALAAVKADTFAAVISGGMQAQAEILLNMANADVKSVTTTQQSDTKVKSSVAAPGMAGILMMSSTDAAVVAKASALIDSIKGTGSSGGTGTGTSTNLVANGNFSNGATGWSGNASNVRTEGGNSFNFADVATAGEPFAVNLSYVLNIPTSGVGYKLRFKASSNRARTMLAGIGLNQDPWTNVTKPVNLTTTQQTFELSLTSNFASATSRVIFDMGADTGQVVIDDVELVLDTAAAPAPAPGPAGGPTAAASAPTALAANVKSIFSDSYTNVNVGAWGPDWGPASARITDGAIAGNNYKTIDMSAPGKEFAGISFVSSKFDATAYTTFNIDYWIDTPLPAGQVINIKLSNHDGGGETSAIQYLVNPVTGGSWQRLSVPMSSFTVAGGGSASRNNIAEIIITAARADTAQPVKVYFDNMYFSQPAPAPVATNLVANGNFSSGATGWSGNASNVRTEGGNSFNFADVATAGEPFAVNLSYVLNIPTSGVGYKLRFKASSNRARTMLAGIGLNQDPWTNVTQSVNLTTTQQTFELSLTSNFANANSRVIFDMGADTGQVVIDDVELVLDTAAAPAPAGGPTAAASVPTALAANVKSIFSDSYTNVAVNEWGPNWGPASARITDGVIAGNNYKTIDMSAAGQEFAGISFVSSKFNATAYTTFNIDYWVDTPLPAGQVINIKLSNHDGSGETSAIQYLVNPVNGGSWQRLSVPMSSFTVAGGGSASRNNIAEIIITAARANTAQPVKVHFDNMYFSQ